MFTTDSEWANVMNYKHYRKIEDEKAKRPLVGFEPATLTGRLQHCASSARFPGPEFLCSLGLFHLRRHRGCPFFSIDLISMVEKNLLEGPD